MKDNIITIDGPSASGKGSLARNIATHLNFDILDSGLLYRVYAYLYDCGFEHSKIVSHIKKDISLKETRSNLLELQRGFYSSKGLVADGRDMGTVVFPNAKLKIFLIASPEVRAKRRYLELQNRGQEVNMLALIDDIKQRDLKDQTRVLSPLIPAEDSVVIDSSDMSLDEVLSFTKKLTKRKLNK